MICFHITLLAASALEAQEDVEVDLSLSKKKTIETKFDSGGKGGVTFMKIIYKKSVTVKEIHISSAVREILHTDTHIL